VIVSTPTIIALTPTHGLIEAGMAHDVAALSRAANIPWIVVQGSILPNVRTIAVQQALDRGATHLLLLDSDMRFPPDTARRLWQHHVPIVGANYRQRPTGVPTAMKDGQRVESASKVGCESVDMIGLGVCLVEADVFRRLAAPWFDLPYDAVLQRHHTDDWHFCRLARQAGFPILVDHTLSADVAHLATTAQRMTLPSVAQETV